MEKLNYSDIKINKTLNKKFFDDNDKLFNKIKKGLLKIVDKFKEHLDIEDLHIKDIVLTGSLANYNYNKKSDVDIHILCDTKKINKDEELLVKYFKEKRDSWNNKYDIKIHGYPVQLYAQDYKLAKVEDWAGLYSILNDKWIAKPTKEDKKIDFELVKKGTEEISNNINKLIEKYNNKKLSYGVAIEKLRSIDNNIKKIRKDSLNKEHSEFAIGNLIYKTLRNNGYLDKLRTFKAKLYKDKFTIKESITLIINESQYEDLIKKLKMNTI
jgi:hypothetical protein